MERLVRALGRLLTESVDEVAVLDRDARLPGEGGDATKVGGPEAAHFAAAVTEVSERQLDEYTQIRELIEIPVLVGLAETADRAALEALRPQAQEIVDAACAAMTDRTRLLFFSPVLSPTGLVLPARNHVVVLVSKVHKPTLRALAFARATRPDTLTALTVNVDDDATRALLAEWERHDLPVKLTITSNGHSAALLADDELRAFHDIEF